jgi:hypothetical protein
VLHLASPNGPRKPTTGNAQHTGTQSRTINHTLHKDDLQQLSNKLQHQPPPRRNADQLTKHHGDTADQRTKQSGNLYGYKEYLGKPGAHARLRIVKYNPRNIRRESGATRSLRTLWVPEEDTRILLQVSETDGSDGQDRDGIEEKRFSPEWDATKANQLSVRRNKFLSGDMSALSFLFFFFGKQFH